MSQIELLLNYQKEDEKLLCIEREASNSEERKNFAQAKNFLTKAPDKLEALDGKAVELNALVDRLKVKYEEISETLKDFENFDELVEEGADISFYKKNASQIADKLKSIKSEINSLGKAIKEAEEEYQSFKKKTISVQNQYSEYSVVYKKYKEQKLAEMSAVQKELEKLSANIDPEVMKKYQTKRSERIFPIICGIVNERCPKCGMELSIAGKEKVSSGGVVECENCHRFLYKD